MHFMKLESLAYFGNFLQKLITMEKGIFYNLDVQRIRHATVFEAVKKKQKTIACS